MEILIRNPQGRKVWVPEALYESKKDRNDWEKLGTSEDEDISSLDWGELRTRASQKGVYEVGMNKKDVIKALKNAS